MTLAPIILFVYNRPEHTQKTLDSLMLNELAQESTLYIFSDAPKSEKDIDKVNKVRKIITSLSGFENIQIIKRDKNFGLAKSVISGVTEVINHFGKAIVLEDDIVTSPNFLKFMNDALEFYKDDKKVYSISGYAYPIIIPESFMDQVYISSRPSSWGWATWKDRWEKAVWNPENIFSINNKTELRNLMDKGGKDLAPMLNKSIEGKINSWAVKWAFTHLKNESYCLYPIHSYVKNIGTDASGTNFNKSTSKYNVETYNGDENTKFTNDLRINWEIQKQIQKIVRPGIVSFLKYRLFNIY